MSFTLESTKDVVDIVSSTVTAIGVAAGAVLAWRKWGKTAPLTPRAKLSHDMVHHLLSPQDRLVRVSLDICNTGEATVFPFDAYSFVQQVSPLGEGFVGNLRMGQAPMNSVTKTEFDWPQIGRRDYPQKRGEMRIDSNESDRLECEFIIPADVSAIFIYSSVCLDPEEPDLGWDITTFHRLTPESKPG